MQAGELIHVMHAEKFIEPFIEFVEDNFDDFEGRHMFFVSGDINKFHIKSRSNLKNDYKSKRDQLKYFLSMAFAIQKANKVILHGLFVPWYLILLSMMPWNLKKCCWVIWGGDLYTYKLSKRSLRWWKNELFRRFVIKRLGFITTTVPGDFELARVWYSTKAIFIQNLMYPSHIARIVNEESQAQNELVVQIGNSADPSNNHFEIIDRLSALSLPTHTKVTAPLSYGDMNYAQQVIDYAHLKLGDLFFPITNFMSYDDYNKYMSTVSVVIFNHKRQQAMGNTIALLSLGKKVYLRSDVTPWAYLKSLGLHIYDTTSHITLEQLSPISSKSNISICKLEFNNEKLFNAWHEIFETKL